MAVSLTVYEIFSIKVLRDLENWVRGYNNNNESISTAQNKKILRCAG